MGAPKQLLRVDDKPMLLGVVDALLAGGCDAVVIVAHSDVRNALPPLSDPRVRLAINDEAGSEMIDSVRIGLGAEHHAGGYLVCPCDAVGLTPDDVRRCIEAFGDTPDRIVIATCAGRKGHPMIFPGSLVEAVSSSECDAGLNQLARNRPQLVRLVACDSPGTIANINTPADYEQLEGRAGP